MIFNGRAIRILLLAGLIATMSYCNTAKEEDSDTVTEFCNLSLLVCDQNRQNCKDNSTVDRDDAPCEAKFYSCLFALCQSNNLKF